MHVAPHNENGMGRRILIVFMAAVVLLTGTAIVAPQPAEAWVRASKTGKPGSLVIPSPMAIDEYDGFVMYMTWRTSTGPLVYRSPATRGPQRVVGVYTVQEWTPSFGWTNTTTQTTNTFRIRRGVNAIRLPELYRAPQTTRGYFRVRFAFAWANARTGRILGTAEVLPDRASDHQCVTTFRPCETGAGWIRTGRLYTHGGGW